MNHLLNENWHALSTEKTAELFESDIQEGLSPLDIKHREDFFGLNEIKQQQKETKLKKFFMQFHNALIYILLAASLITFFLGEYIDSAVIFAVIIINVIVGFVQEIKAQEAIESLKNLVDTNAIVIREGKKHEISSKHLVPGDIVLLESGFKVPADMRLIDVNDLKVDESMLTGESLPVNKEIEKIEENTLLNDRNNMIYSGTFVTYGRAKGIVVATAGHTQVGKIAHLISETVSLETPLTKKISQFSKLLLYIILVLAAFTLFVGVLRDYSFVEMFMASVALAVGAIPEGLPAAVTITLAIGVHKMAKKNAIIRKLPAVETLGSVTTICSDKTGTLTQNKMFVTKIFTSDNLYEVNGVGYEPKGDVLLDKKVLEKIPNSVYETLLSSYLCNEAYLVEKNKEYEISGDPTEGALIVAALKMKIDEYEINKTYKRLDILPFESDRQYMATLNKNVKKDINEIHIKGSIEKVLPLCQTMLSENSIEKIDLKKIEEEAVSLASQGLRVLAIAKKETNIDKIEENILKEEFVFLGLVAMIDPPRQEAIQSVKACKTAGINIIMITGDHALTAFSIAKMMGILKVDDSFEDVTLNAKELHNLSDEQLIEKLKTVKVFARVEPEQKLRIVDALQARQEVVAMTGDGVNDAPALKQADIGIAMGKSGTEVAKEAADMLLTDDNFSSIATAVKEGRNVFDNLIKFITWTLPTNLGEGLVILFSVMLGFSLPILPVQILWINMTTAIFLGLMLVFEKKEEDIMIRPPRNPSTPILSKELFIMMLGVAIYMLITSTTIFEYYILKGMTEDYARTVAVNIFVFIEIFYLFTCKNLHKSTFKINPFDNKNLLYGVGIMVILQIIFTNNSLMNSAFGTTPISLNAWTLIIFISFIIIFIVEVLKYFLFSKTKVKS
ncbi:carbonate dehydratase [Halarcobacter mediterraneus]|uniref:Carbonate dehydratase n=1 Tax=Halarcobacter mediterraneus TaxID=2023153 RepID=A0A4Q1AWC4_9BACT|nr:cation-transporting P-type ATPase [Halarcobacter mediterraneus]RXK14454.1 carbonate dehydratase [Halarcobacter mediterraneus]